MSAIHDDLDEWSEFTKKYKLHGVKWDVYSEEAQIAKEYIKSNPLDVRPQVITQHVQHAMEQKKLLKTHAEERKALIDALALVGKYSSWKGQ